MTTPPTPSLPASSSRPHAEAVAGDHRRAAALYPLYVRQYRLERELRQVEARRRFPINADDAAQLERERRDVMALLAANRADLSVLERQVAAEFVQAGRRPIFPVAARSVFNAARLAVLRECAIDR